MKRWWIYQKERFPIVANGLLIAVFSAASVGYSILLREGQIEARSIGAMVAAFWSLFLFFVQLRVADEFKDFEDDRRYRAYRPVPRGLVTLRELGTIGLFAAVIQLGLALAASWRLVGLLAIVWGYLGLMSREFFVPNWLKKRPIVYLLSHAVIMPLLALYGSAWNWLAAGAAMPNLSGFLLVSFGISLAIEIGRKIRVPSDEEPGVETYSALWGTRNAVTAWLSAVWLVALAAVLAAYPIQAVWTTALILLLLLTASIALSWRFLSRPDRALAKGFTVLSGLWTIGVYFSLGILPLL